MSSAFTTRNPCNENCPHAVSRSRLKNEVTYTKKAARYGISSSAQKQPVAHMQFMLVYVLEKALEENKAISNIT